MISAKELQESLHYNSGTGEFVWKTRPSTRVKIGDIAGTKTVYGYTQIRFKNRFYKAHRLAWLYVTGNWPDNEIDHINGVRDDNKWKNLRDVTAAMNRQNQRVSRSTSGFFGVTKYYNKYTAKIGHQNKTIYIGTYDTAESAYRAYLEVKRRIHDGCTI